MPQLPTDSSSLNRPYLLTDKIPEGQKNFELNTLRKLQQAGHPITPLVVVPSAAKEEFYRLNNIVPKLLALFAGVDLNNPDEDDIEELAPQIQEILRTHYLLEDFIDSFYSSIANLPARVIVRPANLATSLGSPLNFSAVTRGRPALLALKSLWEADWSYDALWQRFTQQQTSQTATTVTTANTTTSPLAKLAPASDPVLIYASGEVSAPDSLNQAASDILKMPVVLHTVAFTDGEHTGGICRVARA